MDQTDNLCVKISFRGNKLQFPAFWHIRIPVNTQKKYDFLEYGLELCVSDHAFYRYTKEFFT